MFNWLRRKKAASSGPSAHDEDAGPPPIRKPQHAYRDARMSIPVAEREFYETIQARKLASNTSSNAASITNSKGKIRSPLRYGSDGFLSYTSTPASSGAGSHNGSRGSLTGLWDAVAQQARHDSSAQTSVAESSKDAAAREWEMKTEDAVKSA